LIDVHQAPVEGRMSFTQALYEHVQTLKAEDARAQQQAQLADSESLAGEEETALAMREVTRARA
jgi:hypothetical protein